MTNGMLLVSIVRKKDTKETSFKIHGMPKLFKEMNEKKTAQNVNAMTSNPSGQSAQETVGEDLKSLIRNEIQKLLDATNSIPKSPMEINNARIHYAGNLADSLVQSVHHDMNSWLIDSGATCHIGTHKSLFTHLKPLNYAQSVFLPDGTCCKPQFIRSVSINSFITLSNIYFIPSFKFNLLSVGALLKERQLKLIFSPGSCVI